MEEKKYELLENDKIKVNGHTLYRIRAVRDFNGFKKGDEGGYIEKEENLSHSGLCWVSGNAIVYGEARVTGNARVCGEAAVFENAIISENAKVIDNAKIYGCTAINGFAHVGGCAEVFDFAVVSEKADVFQNAVISGRATVNGKVFGSARVYDHAKIYKNARVYDNAEVYGYAEIHDTSWVFNTAVVHENAKVIKNSRIGGNTNICGKTIATKFIANGNETYNQGDTITGDKYKMATKHSSKKENISYKVGDFVKIINDKTYHAIVSIKDTTITIYLNGHFDYFNYSVNDIIGEKLDPKYQPKFSVGQKVKAGRYFLGCPHISTGEVCKIVNITYSTEDAEFKYCIQPVDSCLSVIYLEDELEDCEDEVYLKVGDFVMVSSKYYYPIESIDFITNKIKIVAYYGVLIERSADNVEKLDPKYQPKFSVGQKVISSRTNLHIKNGDICGIANRFFNREEGEFEYNILPTDYVDCVINGKTFNVEDILSHYGICCKESELELVDIIEPIKSDENNTEVANIIVKNKKTIKLDTTQESVNIKLKKKTKIKLNFN